MAGDLAGLESGEARLAALKAAAGAARADYDRQALGLSARRAEAARALEKSVAKELPALRLDRAEFMVALASDPARGAESGIDEVAFLVRTNPGTRPGPLMKVASGGELARFLFRRYLHFGYLVVSGKVYL